MILLLSQNEGCFGKLSRAATVMLEQTSTSSILQLLPKYPFLIFWIREKQKRH